MRNGVEAMPKKGKMFTLSNLLLGVLATVFLLCLAVVLTLNFRPLYYFDIEHLNIAAMCGLSEAEIRANYDALIDYNSIFWRGALQFPSLPMSQTGRIHFEEVKNIFDGVQLLLLGTFVGTLVAFVLKLKRGEYRFLKLASILSVGLPAVLGGLIALNWQRFFVLFHKLFFNNDYWIFDAATDPVILILPDTYFMHCALMILGLVVMGSAALYLAYRLARARQNKKAAAGAKRGEHETSV